jgi:hypothetical protein
MWLDPGLPNRRKRATLVEAAKQNVVVLYKRNGKGVVDPDRIR